MFYSLKLRREINVKQANATNYTMWQYENVAMNFMNPAVLLL